MNNKNYIWISIIAIVFLVVIIIYFVFSILLGGSKVTLPINKYDNLVVDKTKYIANYVTDFIIDLVNGDTQAVWDKMDSNYLKLNNINNKEQLMTILKSKKLDNLFNVGMRKYFEYTYNGNYVYVVTLQDNRNRDLAKLTIFETSPKHYTMAFDGFIDGSNEKKIIKAGNLDMEINNVVLYENEVHYSVRIKNNSNSNVNVKLNYRNNNIKAMYGNEEVYARIRLFESVDNVIRKDAFVDGEIIFAIQPDDYNKIDSIVVTNVFVNNEEKDEIFKMK